MFNTEGYCQISLSHDSIIEPTDDGYHYYYRNYLGSICAVWNATKDTIVQRISYHPSGLPIGSNESLIPQNRKYNGKEFIEAYGLDEYDSQARHYYPAIARTTTMDPLAEKYYSISPYAWCANNPVNVVDPLGLDTINIDQEGNIVSTIESDEADVFNIVEQDEDGNYVVKTDEEGNPLSIGFEYGTIEQQITYNTEYINKEDCSRHEITMDIIKIRGDDNAKTLFEFLSNNITAVSGIEYSHYMTGISGNQGLNFITTGHEKKSDGSGTLLFNTQLINGYTIRVHNHSHPYTNIPSNGDYNFQEYILRNLMNNNAVILPYFNIFFVKDGKYYRY